MTIEEIKAALVGYHVTISLYPTGGAIEITGCEECGTDESVILSSLWRDGNTSRGTPKQALDHLLSQIAEETL